MQVRVLQVVDGSVWSGCMGASDSRAVFSRQFPSLNDVCVRDGRRRCDFLCNDARGLEGCRWICRSLGG